MPPDYTFRKVTRADYPMIRRWLDAPHVAAIWGTPDEEIALIEAEIGGGDCQMYIVEAGAPFAFVQDWGADLADVPHYGDMPAGTRSLDTFLGDPDYLGQGHAKGYIRQYAEALIAGGAPRVVTDPRLSNPRGIAMYRGAGFRPIDIRTCEDGAPVQVMEFAP